MTEASNFKAINEGNSFSIRFENQNSRGIDINKTEWRNLNFQILKLNLAFQRIFSSFAWKNWSLYKNKTFRLSCSLTLT